jgi:asparagine synthase (glutamine-hydrolysing)
MCERKYQKVMADAVHSIHHDVPFDVARVDDYFERMVYHAECPSKETYNAACMALSEEASSTGIKVILTGQGSDEFFAGYPGYRLDRFFGPTRESLGYEVSNEEKLRIRLWGDRSLVYDGNYADLQQLKARLYATDVVAELPRFDSFRSLGINRARIRGRHVVHKRSYLDFKLRLVDHLLADHGDRMAMANGVEVRHPVLDIDLVNFLTQVPPDLKLKDFEEKYLVKQIAAGFVPRQIIEREKFGWFAAGGAELIRSGTEWIQDMLSFDRIARQGYFNPEAVEALKQQYSAKDFRLNQPLEADILVFVLSFGVLLDTFATSHPMETAREHHRDLGVLS